DEGIVPPSDLLPLRVPFGEIRQFHTQNRGLKRVDACIPADEMVIVPRLHAMNTQASHALGPTRVVGHHHSSVAKGAQILARIETETANRSQRSGFFSLILRAKYLRRILDDRHVMTLPDAP